MDIEYEKIYLKAVEKANEVNQVPSKPRTCGRQKHRAIIHPKTCLQRNIIESMLLFPLSLTFAMN